MEPKQHTLNELYIKLDKYQRLIKTIPQNQVESLMTSIEYIQHEIEKLESELNQLVPLKSISVYNNYSCIHINSYKELNKFLSGLVNNTLVSITYEFVDGYSVSIKNYHTNKDYHNKYDRLLSDRASLATINMIPMLTNDEYKAIMQILKSNFEFQNLNSLLGSYETE